MRVLRQSLQTRDLARARKIAVALESADEGVFKPVPDAVAGFLEHCESESLRHSTIRKYRNSLKHLEAFCELKKLDSMAELTTDHLDAFRAKRELKQVTSSKELQLLRQFCGFCLDHRWMPENVAGPHQVSPEYPAERCRAVHAWRSEGDSQGMRPYRADLL